MKKLYCRFALATLVLQSACFVWAQTQQPETLPAAAQTALDKGLAAAKEEQWTIAIQSLDQARQLAPKSPIILFNQALAESRVPGRELRSIVLFKAYLTASPNAANAAAVKDQVASLQIKVDGTVESIFDQAQDIVPKISSTPNNRASAWESLIETKARLGDVNGARQMVPACGGDEYQCLADLASVQAELRDFSGAKITLDEAIHDAFASLNQRGDYDQGDRNYFIGLFTSPVYASIIRYEAEAGNVQDAVDDLAHHPDLIKPQPYAPNVQLLLEIAKAQNQAGQQQAARLTLDRAQGNLRECEKTNPNSTGPYSVQVAAAQLDANDPEGARQTLSLLSPQLRATSDSSDLDDAFLRRALVEWKQGDLNSAKQDMSQLGNGYIVNVYGWKNVDWRAANVICCGPFNRDDLLRLLQARADASELSLTPPSQTVKSPVDTWTGLLNDPLNGPLFTDLHLQLQIISAANTPQAIFQGLLGASQQIYNASGKIRQTEAELAK